MPAIDVFLLNQSMTILPYSNSGSPRAKRDGKFEAEDCICLSFFYRRWPHPPVCRPYLNPFIGFGRDPSADHPLTRKPNGVRAVFFNDG
jgi:hypothetical protein